ncbi:MAG: hypothetical protein ACI8S6_002224, partial [Myxococcota bacterium]
MVPVGAALTEHNLSHSSRQAGVMRVSKTSSWPIAASLLHR